MRREKIDMIELKELSLREIRGLLMDRKITCVEAVEYYLDRIRRFEGPVNCISQLNPDALAIAEELDQNYESKKDLPLYGLPFLVKENIASGDKMKTTAGALALANAVCKEDAPVVAALRKAGAILLGKATCTEMANYKASFMPGGYSAIYGQTHNPYNPAIGPSGSSTGSAAATAMNFCAFSIGTDTGGSVVAPSMVQGTCGLRPVGGSVDTAGIVPICHTLDVWGPICRCADDIAMVFEAANNEPMPEKEIPVEGLTMLVETHESTYMDPDKKAKFEAMLAKLKDAGVKLIDYHFLNYYNIMPIMQCEMKHDIAEYLGKAQDGSGMRTLRDIIDFNSQDMATRAMYDQKLLEGADACSGNMDEPEYLEIMKDRVRERAELIKYMEEVGALGLLAPGVDSVGPLLAFASVCMPIAKLENGINYGCQVLAPTNPLAVQLTKALEPIVGFHFPPEDEVKIDPANVYPENLGKPAPWLPAKK